MGKMKGYRKMSHVQIFGMQLSKLHYTESFSAHWVSLGGVEVGSPANK
jgi:hypothetical protein